MSQFFVSEASSGSEGIQTLTGNSGGPVGPNSVSNISILGSGGVLVVGNPSSNTFSVTGAGSVLLNSQVTLTSTQLKGAGSPLTLVEAQGAGTVIIPISIVFKFTPGATPFSNSPQMALAYAGATNVDQQGALPNNFFTQAVVVYTEALFGGINQSGDGNVEATKIENVRFALHNNGSALTGNATNDAVVVAATQYVVLIL